MARFVVYHNHSGDVGHAVHLLRLARALRRRAPGLRLRLVQAGRPQPEFERRWPGEVVRLPRPFTSVADFGPRVPAAPSAALLRARARRLLAFVADADALVTGFFPFGRLECAPEIVPALARVRAAGGRTFASVPLPYFVHPRERVGELLAHCALYDRLLIHCPAGADLAYMARAVAREGRVTPAEFLGTFRTLGARLAFTGYVLASPRRGEGAAAGARTVLVHRGGGAVLDGLVECALRLRPLLDARLDLLVLAGPATAPARLRRWRALARANGARLERWRDELHEDIRRCAVVVGPAGGAVYEALRWGKRAVLVPFLGSPGRERSDQLARARLLRDLCGATVLSPEGLTSERLAAAVRAQLARREPGPKKRAGWYDGAETSARLMLDGNPRRGIPGPPA
ncbi:MAG: glycosyltransferase [Elusimicrobiota bacterium]|jgi:predicted glycosyltransferase